MAQQKLQTIRPPAASVEALLQTVTDMKTLLDQLTGASAQVASAANLNPQTAAPVTRTFVQVAQPAAVSVGDIWIQPPTQYAPTPPLSYNANTDGGPSSANLFYSDGVVTSVWDGTKWMVINVAGCFQEIYLQAPTGGAINTLQIGPSLGPLGAAGQVWEIFGRGSLVDNAGAAKLNVGLKTDDALLDSFIDESAGIGPNAQWWFAQQVHRYYRLTRPTTFTLVAVGQSSGGSGLVSNQFAYLTLNRLTYLKAKRLL